MTPTKRAGRPATTRGLDAPFRIADVAENVGYSPATIRLWERQGLVEPRRSQGGYRLFDRADLARLKQVAYLRSVEKLNPAAIRRMLGRGGPARVARGGRSREKLGPRLRKLRTERRLTLEKVAAETGLSVSFLSSLERDQCGVSVATLTRLLRFFNTTIAELMASSDGGGGYLTRPGERAQFTDRYGGVTIEQLANGPAQMEPQLFVVERGGGSEGSYVHDGEEFVYVLTGRLEVVLRDADRYLLRPGDCLYYPSTTPHGWRNPGRTVARLLWVNTPPTF